VDRVVLLRFGERHLIVDTVEPVPAVGQPIGPGHQRSAMRAVTHRTQRVGVENRPLTDAVLPHPAADLHRHGDLLAMPDLELPPRRWNAHTTSG
jgi:hypothetical protein